MTSHKHDTPLKLCRIRPGFAPELLREVLGMKLPEHDETLPFSEAATDIEVRDLNCDNIAVCREQGINQLGIILEVQREKDDGKENEKTGRKEGGKRRSWPAYVANVHHRIEAPTILIVICPNQTVADWARVPIELGHPGFVLTVIVLAPDNYPKLTTSSGTGALAEQMVVGTLIHGTAPEAKEILTAAVDELAPLPQELAARYAEYMLGQLDERPRTILEALMQTESYPYQSKLLADSEARGEATMVLLILDERRISVDTETADRITSCTDVDQLKIWGRRAVSIDRAEELFS